LYILFAVTVKTTTSVSSGQACMEISHQISRKVLDGDPVRPGFPVGQPKKNRLGLLMRVFLQAGYPSCHLTNSVETLKVGVKSCRANL